MRSTYLSLAMISLMMVSVASAGTYLGIQGPINGTLHNGGSIYLGKVGPGESFYIQASPGTTNATGTYVNIGWDQLETVSLPAGWASQPSPLYENPMKMKVTVAPETPNGVYNITVRAVNLQNYSRLGNLTFTAYVNVTPDVFGLSVEPTSVDVGTGQPVDLYITINNTGISDDPFVINAEGLPAWNLPDQVIALHATTSTFIYPVFVNEPGIYDFNLTVASSTSQLISRTYNITLDANASLLNDYSAIGQGVVISPVILEPAYSLMLLLSYLYKLITG